MLPGSAYVKTSEQWNPQRQKVEGWQAAAEGRGMGSYLLIGRVSVWEDERVLGMDGVDGCT